MRMKVLINHNYILLKVLRRESNLGFSKSPLKTVLMHVCCSTALFFLNLRVLMIPIINMEKREVCPSGRCILVPLYYLWSFLQYSLLLLIVFY